MLKTNPGQQNRRKACLRTLLEDALQGVCQTPAGRWALVLCTPSPWGRATARAMPWRAGVLAAPWELGSGDQAGSPCRQGPDGVPGERGWTSVVV